MVADRAADDFGLTERIDGEGGFEGSGVARRRLGGEYASRSTDGAGQR